MKQVVLVITLLFVGIGILTARSLSDIDQIEGLDHYYDEFEDLTIIETSYFDWIEGNETYGGRILWIFHGRMRPNQTPYTKLMVYGLSEREYEKELIFLYDGNRLRKTDKRYNSVGLFWISPEETQSLVEADIVKIRVELGSSGLVSNEARKYLNLFYQAIILGNWESIIEADTIPDTTEALPQPAQEDKGE